MKYKPSDGDVIWLMDRQLRGVVAAHEFLGTVVSTQALSLSAIVGMVILMSGIVESLGLLAKRHHWAAAIRSKHRNRFDKWLRMRDDAAHAVEKVMGPSRLPPRGTNPPWYNGGYRLLYYEPLFDTISTGNKAMGSFKVGYNIRIAFNVVRTCTDKWVKGFYKNASQAEKKIIARSMPYARDVRELFQFIQQDLRT